MYSDFVSIDYNVVIILHSDVIYIKVYHHNILYMIHAINRLTIKMDLICFEYRVCVSQFVSDYYCLDYTYKLGNN